MTTTLRVLSCALLFAACGSKAPEQAKSAPAPAPPAANAANPAIEAMLKSVGAALVAKDYAGAYAFVATDARGEVSFDEFKEALEAYLEGFERGLTVAVKVEPYDREGPR